MNRGKSLSITWFGLSVAEFILPITMVFFLTIYSWRSIWLSIGLLIILFLPVLSFFTIRKITLLSREEVKTNIKSKDIKNWKRKEILLDPKFYLISLVMLALPAINTGVFVNQSFILESKNWGDFVIAKSFMFYAILSVTTLFIAGPTVDRYTSRKILPFANIPMFLGLIVLVFFDHSYSAFIFMGLLGITNGITNVLLSSLWAEIYGVNYLGAIKALTGSLMVFVLASLAAVFFLILYQILKFFLDLILTINF